LAISSPFTAISGLRYLAEEYKKGEGNSDDQESNQDSNTQFDKDYGEFKKKRR
jgi:hypothetical protein